MGMLPFLFVLFGASAFIVGIAYGAKMASATANGNDDGDYEMKPKKNAVDDGPRTAETQDRFADDIRLRAAGFAILSRPSNAEPVWIKGGVAFRQSEAVMRLPVPVPECSGVFVG